MDDSILNSIKKLLGIAPEYTQFDQDIVMHINAVFLTLYELGVGPREGFSISDSTATWDSYIVDSNTLALDAVKIYVYQKVRLAFDPPATAAMFDALKESSREFEWRLSVLVDPSTDNGFDSIGGE